VLGGEAPARDGKGGATHAGPSRKLSRFQATASIAITFVMLALFHTTLIFGVIIAFLIWFPKVFYKTGFSLRPSRGMVLSFVLPAFALLSVLWSDYPLSSLKSAAEFTSMVVCAVVVGRVVAAPDFIRGLAVGGALTSLIGSLSADLLGLAPYAWADLGGSHNQFGICAEIGMLFSMVHWLQLKRQPFESIITLGAVLVCALALFLSHSAGALVSMLGTLFMVGVVLLIRMFPMPPRTRGVLVVATIVVLIGAVGVLFASLGQDALKLVGKDSTLTGRTYFWSEGLKVGADQPVLGVGYSAFWVPGRPRAEKYWYQAGIYNKTGFHFHNGYIETFVELGGVGVIIILYYIFHCFFKSLFGYLRFEVDYGLLACLGMTTMFIIRGMVEVDFLGTFSLAVFLFFMLPCRIEECYRLGQAVSGERSAKRRRRPGKWLANSQALSSSQ